MSKAARPRLRPGWTGRTRHLRRFGANPTRLAQRLVREGRLCRATQGLFYVPVPSRFGPAPPPDAELIRAFLDDSPFVITGPPEWNALGLGSTAAFAATLVYNHRRTGMFSLDGRPFLLRRVRFPERPPREWFVVDLIEHRDMAGVSLSDLESALVGLVRRRRWNPKRLLRMAVAYGTRATRAFVERCLSAAGAPA